MSDEILKGVWLKSDAEVMAEMKRLTAERDTLRGEVEGLQKAYGDCKDKRDKLMQSSDTLAFEVIKLRRERDTLRGALEAILKDAEATGDDVQAMIARAALAQGGDGDVQAPTT